MKNKRLFKKVVFLLGILITIYLPEILAQGASRGAPYGPGGASGGAPYGPGGASGGAPYGPPGRGSGGGESVPIDGGAAFLLVAGAAYGIKKIREQRENDKDSSN